MFPRIYADIACPIDGYDLTITLLSNPTFAERQAWLRATLEDPACAACAELRGADGDAHAFCPACSAARAAYGAAAMAVYRAIGDCDLSSPAACVAAFESGVPEELLPWIYGAPYTLWQARSEEIKKKLQPPSPNGSLSADLPAAPSPTT